MHRSIAFHSIAFGMVLLVGCEEGAKSKSRVAHVTKTTPIEFSFPSDWTLNSEKHPFDLQCKTRDEKANVGVFAFRQSDLDEGTTSNDVLQLQIDDISSRRTNVEQLEPLKKEDLADKSITSIAYTAEKDGSPHCYRFSLIEFKADPSRFAVALQVTKPSAYLKNKPLFEEIMNSARLLP